MAWRLQDYLVGGVLDNIVPGKVTGVLRFAGMDEAVCLDLNGDFHRDIRGCGLVLCKWNPMDDTSEDAAKFLNGFSPQQDGEAGDITVGLPPVDYVDYPYIEWYSRQNGRVVIELEPHEVRLIGSPLPADEQQPICRMRQGKLMREYLIGMSTNLSVLRPK